MNQDIEKNTPDPEVREQDAENTTEKSNFHINPHIAILAVIAFILVVVVFKLYIWNKGVPSDYNPDDITDEFDTEPLDIIFPLAPSNLEGRKDDGITTILCLGDDPFTYGRGEEGGLAEQIASKSGATVYNGGFAGTCIAAASTIYTEQNWMDAFSLSYLANAICTRDFSLIKNAISYSDNPDYAPTVAMLEGLDMDTVDIICIMYDGSDYINKRVSDDPNDPYAIVAYTGALHSAITNFQETYPFIRIVVMSHTFCHTADGEDGGSVDLGNGSLNHYLIKEIDVADECGVSIIDNFYGTINADNYSAYMTDYIHFNDTGRAALAQRFTDCIIEDDDEQTTEKSFSLINPLILSILAIILILGAISARKKGVQSDNEEELKS